MVGLKCAASYTAYGYFGRQGSLVESAFNGLPKDNVLGGYFLGNGYRLYMPSVMRFVSQDNFSPFGLGGLNAYMYCNGDPVNKSDRSGRWPDFFRRWIPGRNRSGARDQTVSRPPSPQHARSSSTAQNNTDRSGSTLQRFPALESRRLALENIYSPLPSLVSKGPLSQGGRRLVESGVPEGVVRMTVERNISLGVHLLGHTNLPGEFLVRGVEDLVSSRARFLPRDWENNRYYFTWSRRGINLRNREQWEQYMANSGMTAFDDVETIRRS